MVEPHRVAGLAVFFDFEERELSSLVHRGHLVYQEPMKRSKQASPPMRVIIIGNSACGKSTLAAKLASEHGLEHLDLDTLAWQPTEPPTRVAVELVAKRLRELSSRCARWVVEGCYADLIEVLLPDATELIFVDLPVQACQQNARGRPWEPHKYPSKEAQDAKLELLLAWIADYPHRDGALGRRAHQAIFDSFAGKKQRRVE